MNGFGFIEYDNALDARDVVPGMITLRDRLYGKLTNGYNTAFRGCTSV